MEIPSKYSSQTDEALAAASATDENAFRTLVIRYEKQLITYIRRSTGCDEAQAEDISQEIFIRVYRFINSFDNAFRFSSWIYRIARNEIVSFYRKDRRHMGHISTEETAFLEHLPAIVGESSDIDTRLLDDEKKRKIHEVLYSLPDKYRDVLILRFLEEKDYNEISDIMKMPGGTVATLLNRAKQKLKKKILSNHKWLSGKGSV